MSAAKNPSKATEEQFASLQALIAQGKKQIANYKIQLEEGKIQLADAKLQYEEGVKSLEEFKNVSNSLKNYGVSISTREDNQSYTINMTTFDSMNKLKFSLGSLFIIIGTLVRYSVISRLVNDQIIRIGTKNLDLVKVALQNLRRHLGQNRVAARAHIRSTDEQCIRTIIVYLDGSTAHVAVRNGGALHSDSHTHGTHLAVGHFAQRELFVPAAHLAHLRQAFIQGAAGIGRAIICRHDVALAGNIHLTQGNGVHI